jgi:hypothetical protein
MTQQNPIEEEKKAKSYTVKEALKNCALGQMQITQILKHSHKAVENKDYGIQSDPEYQAHAFCIFSKVAIEMISINMILLHHLGLKEEDNILPETFIGGVKGALGGLDSEEVVKVMDDMLKDATENKVKETFESIIKDVFSKEKLEELLKNAKKS